MDALDNLIGGSDVPLSTADTDLDNFSPLMVTTAAGQQQPEGAIPPGGFTHFLQTSPPIDDNRASKAQSQQQQPQTVAQNVVLMPGVPVYVCQPGEVLDDSQLKKIMEESTFRYGLGKLYKVEDKYCFVPDHPPSSHMYQTPSQTHIQTFPAAQHCTAHGTTNATYHIIPQQTTAATSTGETPKSAPVHTPAPTPQPQPQAQPQQLLQIPQFVNQNGQMILQFPQNGMISAPVNVVCQPQTAAATKAASRQNSKTVTIAAAASSKKPKKILPKPSLGQRSLAAIAPAPHPTYAQIKPSDPVIQPMGQIIQKGGRKINMKKTMRRPVAPSTVQSAPTLTSVAPAPAGTPVTTYAGQNVCCHHQHQHVHVRPVHNGLQQPQGAQCVYPINSAVPVDQVQWQQGTSHQHCVVQQPQQQQVHCPLHMQGATNQHVVTHQTQVIPQPTQMQTHPPVQTQVQTQAQLQATESQQTIVNQEQNEERPSMERDFLYEAVLAAFGDDGVPEVTILDGNPDEMLADNNFANPGNTTTEGTPNTRPSDSLVLPTVDNTDNKVNISEKTKDDQEHRRAVETSEKDTLQVESSQDGMQYSNREIMDVMSVAVTMNDRNKESSATNDADAMTDQELGMLLDDTHPPSTQTEQTIPVEMNPTETTSVHQSSPKPKGLAPYSGSELMEQRSGGIPKKSPGKRRANNRARSDRITKEKSNVSFSVEGNTNTPVSSDVMDSVAKRTDSSNDYDFMKAITDDFPQNQPADSLNELDNDSFAAVFGEKEMDPVCGMLMDSDGMKRISKDRKVAELPEKIMPKSSTPNSAGKIGNLLQFLNPEETNDDDQPMFEPSKMDALAKENALSIATRTGVSNVNFSGKGNGGHTAEFQLDLSTFGDHTRLEGQNETSTESMDTSTGGASSNRNLSDSREPEEEEETKFRKIAEMERAIQDEERRKEEEKQLEEEQRRIEQLRLEEEQQKLAEMERIRLEEEQRKAEAERIKAEEAERKRLEEEMRKKAEEAERKRLEEERKRAEEAERRRLEEEERRKAEEEEEKRRLEEAERKRLEEKRRKAEEAERKRQEEKKRKAEEAERRRLEEKKRKAEEAERKRLEEERRKAEEAERKRLEEQKKAEEAERKRLEEEERKRLEEEERKRLEEEERKKTEELEERRRLDEIRKEEARKKREAERLKREEARRKKNEERKRREEERKRKIEEEKKRKEEERKAEEERRLEEEERLKQAEEERRKKEAEEEMRKKEAEEEKRRKVDEERQRRTEEEMQKRIEEEKERKRAIEEEKKKRKVQEKERKKMAVEEKRKQRVDDRRKLTEKEAKRVEERDSVMSESEKDIEPPQLQCEMLCNLPESNMQNNSAPIGMMAIDKIECMIMSAKVSFGLSSTDDSGNRSQLETSDLSSHRNDLSSFGEENQWESDNVQPPPLSPNRLACNDRLSVMEKHLDGFFNRYSRPIKTRASFASCYCPPRNMNTPGSSSDESTNSDSFIEELRRPPACFGTQLWVDHLGQDIKLSQDRLLHRVENMLSEDPSCVTAAEKEPSEDGKRLGNEEIEEFTDPNCAPLKNNSEENCGEASLDMIEALNFALSSPTAVKARDEEQAPMTEDLSRAQMLDNLFETAEELANSHRSYNEEQQPAQNLNEVERQVPVERPPVSEEEDQQPEILSSIEDVRPLPSEPEREEPVDGRNSVIEDESIVREAQPMFEEDTHQTNDDYSSDGKEPLELDSEQVQMLRGRKKGKGRKRRGLVGALIEEDKSRKRRYSSSSSTSRVKRSRGKTGEDLSSIEDPASVERQMPDVVDLSNSERLPTHSYQVPEKDHDGEGAPVTRFDSSNGRLLLKINLKHMPVVPPVADPVKPVSDEETTTHLLTNCNEKDDAFVDRKVSPIRLSRRRVDDANNPYFHVVCGRQQGGDGDDVDEDAAMEELTPIAEAMETIYGSGAASFPQVEERHTVQYVEEPATGRASLPRAAKTTCKSNLAADALAEKAVENELANPDDLVRANKVKPPKTLETLITVPPLPVEYDDVDDEEEDDDEAEEHEHDGEDASPPPQAQPRKFFKSAKEDRRSSKRNSSYVASQLFFKHGMNSYGKNAPNATAANNAGAVKKADVAPPGVMPVKRKRGRPPKNKSAMPPLPQKCPTPPQQPSVESGIASQVTENLQHMLSPSEHRTVLVLKRRGNEYSIKPPRDGGEEVEMLTAEDCEPLPPDSYACDVLRMRTTAYKKSKEDKKREKKERKLHRKLKKEQRKLRSGDTPEEEDEDDDDDEDEELQQSMPPQSLGISSAISAAMSALPSNTASMPPTLNTISDTMSALPTISDTMSSLPNMSGTMPSIPGTLSTLPNIPDAMSTLPSLPNTMSSMPTIPVAMPTMPNIPGAMPTLASMAELGEVVEERREEAKEDEEEEEEGDEEDEDEEEEEEEDEKDEEDCLFPAEEVTKLRQNDPNLLILQHPPQPSSPVPQPLEEVGPPLLTPVSLPTPAPVPKPTPGPAQQQNGSSETSSSPGNSFSEPTVPQTGSRPSSGHQETSSSSPLKKRRYPMTAPAVVNSHYYHLNPYPESQYALFDSSYLAYSAALMNARLGYNAYDFLSHPRPAPTSSHPFPHPPPTHQPPNSSTGLYPDPPVAHAYNPHSGPAPNTGQTAYHHMFHSGPQNGAGNRYRQFGPEGGGGGSGGDPGHFPF